MSSCTEAASFTVAKSICWLCGFSQYTEIMRIVIELELLFQSIRSDGKKKTMGKKNPWFCLLHSRCVIRSDNYPVTQLLPPASLELAII